MVPSFYAGTLVVGTLVVGIWSWGGAMRGGGAINIGWCPCCWYLGLSWAPLLWRWRLELGVGALMLSGYLVGCHC
jgi:hypothetical protein